MSETVVTTTISGKHRLEAALAAGFMALMRALPLDTASALGGFIGRTIGPRLGITKRAARNFRRAFPEKSEAEVAQAMRDMWDNLGRTAAELPNLHRIQTRGPDSRVEMVGFEVIDAMRTAGNGGIVFSGHLANWEIMPLAAGQHGMPLSLIYRAANNPLVDAMILEARAAASDVHLPKGSQGAREAVAVIRRKGHLGILVDQKLNNGIPIPFFGRDAMTAPALAQLALKYGLTVVPGAVTRLKGCHFRLTVQPPLPLPDTGDRDEDTRLLMTAVNRCLEDAIRAAPAQWLWLHRRWPDS